MNNPAGRAAAVSNDAARRMLLRSAYRQGAGHNLRLCRRRGLSLRGAPHPWRRDPLRGALRLFIRTGCLPNRRVKACKRLAMARNPGNLFGNGAIIAVLGILFWNEAGGGHSAAKPVAARIAGESYNRKDRLAIWQSVRLELRHSAQNRAVYCVPSGRDSRLERPGRYSRCSDAAEVDLDCPGPHPRHLFLARSPAVLFRDLAAHLQREQPAALPASDHDRSRRDAGSFHSRAAGTSQAYRSWHAAWC